MSDSVEHHMEIAFRPGVFIPDRVCFSFVSDLEQVAAEIARLVEAEPARACKLYELFLAACQQKADELDDSSASFAKLIYDLVCAWIQARQAADANPDKTARKLLAWIDNDQYGFFYGIEDAVTQAFDKSGSAAFEKLVRPRFEADHRHWGSVLKAIYRHQKNIAAYVALAEQNGLTAEDCHTIATLIAAEDKTEEALAWIERGLANARPGTEYDLVKLQRGSWIRLGRVRQALEAAWNDFRKFPGKYRYDELMKYVAEADRAVWHSEGHGSRHRRRRRVRERHSRKTGFMPGFERVVAGSHRTRVPSFLDLARSRWGTTDDL